MTRRTGRTKRKSRAAHGHPAPHLRGHRLPSLYRSTSVPQEESVVNGLQRVQIDDDDEADAIGSLQASAEALRLTAAAPPRNQNMGGDYE